MVPVLSAPAASRRTWSRALLLALMIAGALGVLPVAASAATMNLEAPSSVQAMQQFSVTASGQADKDASVFIYLQFDSSPCAPTPREAENRRARQAYQYEGQRVAAGSSYSATGRMQTSQQGGRYTICGYLAESFSAPVEAQAARPVTVVGDSDGDGVHDDADRCPSEFGSDSRTGQRTADGCPVRDSDGDGVVDGSDRCPAAPGRDPATGAQTADGCTPPDADADRVADANDQCPLENAESGVAKKDAARPGCLESGFRLLFAESYETLTGREKPKGTTAKVFIVQTTGILRARSFKVTVTLTAASARKAKLSKREIASTAGEIPATGESTFRDVYKKPKPTAATMKKLRKLKAVSLKYAYSVTLVNGETRKMTESYKLKKGKPTKLSHVVFGSGTNAGGEEL